MKKYFDEFKNSIIARMLPPNNESKEEKKELQKQSKQIKGLEKELQQKEKALAETASLLTLKKKSNRSGGIQRTKNNPCRSAENCCPGR